MRLLDLFCGMRGAARGYAAAGFSAIVGVDTVPQKLYPFDFVQTDAMEIVSALSTSEPCGYDLIHASPPCQRYSTATPETHRDRHPDLLPQVLRLLREGRNPYVVENVEGARLMMRRTVMLCGTMFGLPLRKHRWFECSFPMLDLLPPCDHSGRLYKPWTSCWGPYRTPEDPVADVRRAMGLDVGTNKALRQALPPRYTEFLGRAAIAAMNGHP